MSHKTHQVPLNVTSSASVSCRQLSYWSNPSNNSEGMTPFLPLLYFIYRPSRRKPSLKYNYCCSISRVLRFLSHVACRVSAWMQHGVFLLHLITFRSGQMIHFKHPLLCKRYPITNQIHLAASDLVCCANARWAALVLSTEATWEAFKSHFNGHQGRDLWEGWKYHLTTYSNISQEELCRESVSTKVCLRQPRRTDSCSNIDT